MTIADKLTAIADNVQKVYDAGKAAGGGGTAEGCVTVTFMNGDTVLFTRPVYIGDDCPDPVTQGRIDTPTKESTVQYDYTHNGWSGDLTSITEDTTFEATYTESVRMYTISFYDGDTLLNTEQVPYGGSSNYIAKKEGYVLAGWAPQPKNITGDMDCYASWDVATVFADVSWATISAASADGSASSRWAVGDTKSVTLAYDDGTTEDIDVRIVGFNHDIAEDGSTIGISLACATLPSVTFANKSATHINGYANPNRASEEYSLRGFINNTIYTYLPTDLQALIVPATKTANYQGSANTHTIYDKCWALSYTEVSGDTMSGCATLGSKYAYFTSAARRKMSQNGTYVDWWLRDEGASTSHSTCPLFIGNTGSGWKSSNTTAQTHKAVCFGFCI